MSRRKAGLHKQVSSIFNGVPIPESDATQQPPDVSPPKSPDYSPPSHLAPTTPEHRQPTEPPPKPAQKPAPLEQTKTYAIKETVRQIPWQQTWERIKDKLFTPKPGVSTSRQITMAVVVPVLFIVMIVIFAKVLSKPSPTAAIPTASGSVNNNAVVDSKTDWQIPEPYPQTLRDPMQLGSIATTAGGAAKLIVKGIVYSDDNPSAVVGNQIVREGDKISDATVIKINRDSVEFEINGERRIQKVQ